MKIERAGSSGFITFLFGAAAITMAVPRQPRYPLKTARTLWSDTEIAEARENVARYPQAKKIEEGIIKDANYWLDWKDEDLVRLITDSRVPRAFETGIAGCPKCGTKMLEKFGQYGWIIDPKVPFKVKCPVDGSVYPSNDYNTYYRSGFKIKKGWNTRYVDDGWGWTGPNGEKYWFVAYWNHWIWENRIVPGVLDLSRAYLLTGDKRYAHKAVVMLHRIAEVYPSMDYQTQSRYGTMMAARGIKYPGKVVNLIWETGLARSVAEAYDNVWDTIDNDQAAQELFGQSGRQIRSFIEANFLEDAIDAYFQGRIRGNFGMHQLTLVYLGLIRQFGDQGKWFDGLLNYNDPTTDFYQCSLGLNYALYDNITRDGFPEENAPGYNFLWVQSIAQYGAMLTRTGRDIFALSKTKRLFDAPLDQVVIQCKTPSIGDSGTVWGQLAGQDASVYQIAARVYADPRYIEWLAQMGATGARGFSSFESLMYPPIEAKGKLGPQKSRLLDGYGEAILNNPADTSALSLFYGFKAGHGNFARLNIGIFAGKHAMTPSLGYPDEMNDYSKGLFAWSKNTISHNTVTVDARRQVDNVPGRVSFFADSPFARAVDVRADGTYPQCSDYRRADVMVDVDGNHSYFVDFFNVTGGQEHDYSLHGPPGKFKMIGGTWSRPAPGTLAGTNVKWGYLYDDPAKEAKGYKDGFGTYGGSGFQYLFNVRRSSDSDWVAQYTFQQNQPGLLDQLFGLIPFVPHKEEAKLRIRILPQPGQEMLLCDAHVSPVKNPRILRYLIARREGHDLTSRFASVIEPFDNDPLIQSVERQGWDGAEVVVVNRTDGKRDVIFYNPQGGERSSDVLELRTDASVAVATFDGDKVERAFFAGGTFLDVGGEHLTGQSLTGKVVDTEPARSVVRVKLDRGETVNPQDLIGRVVYFVNNIRRTAHPIIAAKLQGNELVLTTMDELLVGRARLTGIKANALTTTTPLHLSMIYPGTTVCTLDYRNPHEVRDVEDGTIHLADELAPGNHFKTGHDIWLVDVGAIDSFEAPAICWWQADGP